MGLGGGSGARTRRGSNGPGSAWGVRQAEAAGGIGECRGQGASQQGPPRPARRARSAAPGPPRPVRRARSAAPPPSFVELVGPPAIGLAERLIELEGPQGKMRVQWKGTTAPELAGLSRALWERT